MFTVELKINGALIGHVHGINKGLYPEGKGETLYNYEYYNVEERDLIAGHVLHKRDDGLPNLVRLILEDMENR